MYKIQIVNKDWQILEVLDFAMIPNKGDYVYSRIFETYYLVDIVVHDTYEERFLFWNIKKQSINLIVTVLNENEKKLF